MIPIPKRFRKRLLKLVQPIPLRPFYRQSCDSHRITRITRNRIHSLLNQRQHIRIPCRIRNSLIDSILSSVVHELASSRYTDAHRTERPAGCTYLRVRFGGKPLSRRISNALLRCSCHPDDAPPTHSAQSHSQHIPSGNPRCSSPEDR